MQFRWIGCVRSIAQYHAKAPRRLYSTGATAEGDRLAKTTRNIGIIAHIDAVSLVNLAKYGGANNYRVKRQLRSVCSTIVATQEE
jgi:hypothetical protein